MPKKYFDTKSQQVVELIECNDKERFLLIKPIGEISAVRLEFSKGFFPSVYLEKYFIKMEES